MWRTSSRPVIFRQQGPRYAYVSRSKNLLGDSGIVGCCDELARAFCSSAAVVSWNHIVRYTHIRRYWRYARQWEFPQEWASEWNGNNPMRMTMVYFNACKKIPFALERVWHWTQNVLTYWLQACRWTNKKKKDNGNVSSECMLICTLLSCRLFQKYSLMVNGTGDDSTRKRKWLETKLIILQSGLESILYSPKMVDN